MQIITQSDGVFFKACSSLDTVDEHVGLLSAFVKLVKHLRSDGLLFLSFYQHFRSQMKIKQ